MDEDYGFHSRFTIRGATIENHSQFFDDNRHKSDVRFQKLLFGLLDEDVRNGRLQKSPIPNCYLPSATWNALFVLRHAGEHFAGCEITLRHILDLGTMYRAHCNEIDWRFVLEILKKENLMTFYNAVATICVRNLGCEASCFRGYTHSEKLAEKVLADIFAEKENLPMTTKGINGLVKVKYGVKKSLRWYRNRWKYQMVYNESLWDSYWGLAINRLKH